MMFVEHSSVALQDLIIVKTNTDFAKAIDSEKFQ